MKKNNKNNFSYLLESTNENAIKQAKELAEKQLKFSWTQYSELALQREEVIDDLKESLITNCTLNYSFKNYQRAVKHKFSRHPLCTIGSVSYVGGRFNMGDSINTNITPFHALYVAENKDTALQEHLSQGDKHELGLTTQEIALNAPQSESIISINGNLEKIIDLTNKESLSEFVKIIGKFKHSKHLVDLAKHAKMDTPIIIRNTDALINAVLIKEWRLPPVAFNVPSPSQIFGQLIMSAGISGILYPSKFTNRNCMAIFLQNFKDTQNTIKIADAEHDDDYVISELNAGSYECAEWSRDKFSKTPISTLQ